MAKIVGSLNSFKKTLANNGVKGNYQKIVDDALIGDNGTGSFILDFLTRGKIGKNEKYKQIQRTLSDADMRLGGKAYKFFNNRKSKGLNSLKKSFVSEHDILKNKGRNGALDEYVKIKRTGITTPISKTKNQVLPFAGTMAIGSMLSKNSPEESEEYNYEK